MAEIPETLRCFREEHAGEKLKDDNVLTVTSVEQKTVELNVEEAYKAFRIDRSTLQPVLQREKHFQYLKKGLRHLSESYSCLDASRPWLCYWILHSLELLGEPIDDCMASDICQFLSRCQSPNGGFAGGPGQEPHLAPTYAAVNALCIIGTEEAYNVINREKLLEFLYSVKQPNGSFTMHVSGEVDVRSAYCAASVASLTNIITPTLFEGTPEWVLRCQNWEGGIGGVPGMEAHGGYTFCGMAAMVILKKEWMLDLKALLKLDSSVDWGLVNVILVLSRVSNAINYTIILQSLAQHFGSGELLHEVIVGEINNRLEPIHPVYNISPEKVAQAVMHFLKLPVPQMKSNSN
ncbi:hypothetical protein chiPu_0016647 [Chiloscyllium punctatum]|uniref:Protein farnesyltransferase subunit beta n=1 Tax=Chiloscyllium punctatum TaxID=137246 RepID=A0A401T649_CHIPU|nr:hypothetical protein [Chiloscyllium punctatum]